MLGFLKGLFRQLSAGCGVSHFSSLLPNAFTLLLHKIHVLLNTGIFLVAHMNRLDSLSLVSSEPQLTPDVSVSSRGRKSWRLRQDLFLQLASTDRHLCHHFLCYCFSLEMWLDCGATSPSTEFNQNCLEKWSGKERKQTCKTKARKKSQLLNTVFTSSIPVFCFSLISCLIKLCLCSLHSHSLPRTLLWLRITSEKKLMRLAALLQVCVETREHIASIIGSNINPCLYHCLH